MTAHDWLCAGAVFALTFGIFLALIWGRGEAGVSTYIATKDPAHNDMCPWGGSVSWSTLLKRDPCLCGVIRQIAGRISMEILAAGDGSEEMARAAYIAGRVGEPE